jgi:hypothetical protein
MECRRFLKNSGVKYNDIYANPVDSVVCSFEPISEPSYINPHLTNTGINPNSLAFRAKDCNSETKVLHTNNSISAEKPNNPLSYLAVVESFEKDEVSSHPLIAEISKLYAEDVFDVIFPTTNPSISLDQYESIISKNFGEKEKLMKLFKLGDKSLNNTLMATDFGRLLLTNCNYKPSPNPVK